MHNKMSPFSHKFYIKTEFNRYCNKKMEKVKKKTKCMQIGFISAFSNQTC